MSQSRNICLKSLLMKSSRVITDAIKNFIPVHQKKYKPLKPCMNQQLFRAVKRKRELWDHYQANRTEEKYQIFRHQNNKLKQQINEARRKYECEMLSHLTKSFSVM